VLKHLIYNGKAVIRWLDVRWARKVETLSTGGVEVRAFRTRYWNEATDEFMQKDIDPYYAEIPPGFEPKVIVDAGVASGLFSISAAKVFKGAKVFGFEPSRRNCLLARKNARINGLAGEMEIVPCGLWDRNAILAFRTNGAISAMQGADDLLAAYPFLEKVEVVALDAWEAARKPGKIDLIKMDIEGSELEALKGAERLLREHRPLILLQAYHHRGGIRCYEDCDRFLRQLGYETRETAPGSGYLIAR
jgi:FkbM family methyltransferase